MRQQKFTEPEITIWLNAWRSGDERALDEVLPHLYGDLQRLAASLLRGEGAARTLETRDLVHEAFLRLVDQRRVEWQNREHFLAIASRVLRRVLIDRARRRAVDKRGGGQHPLRLDEALDVLDPERDGELLAVDAALDELAREAPEIARVVELRFFGGLEHSEAAKVLGVSEPTVRRRWRWARAWLFHRLGGTTGDARCPQDRELGAPFK